MPIVRPIQFFIVIYSNRHGSINRISIILWALTNTLARDYYHVVVTANSMRIRIRQEGGIPRNSPDDF